MSNYETNVKVRITGMGDLDKLERRLGEVKSVPIKLDVKSSGIKELLTDLKAVQNAAKSIGNIKIGTSGGGNSFNASSVTKEFKNLQSMYKSFNNTKIKIASLDATKDVAQITALEKRLSGLKKQFESAFSSVGVKNMSSSQISSLTKNLHDMEGALSLLKAKGQDAFNFKTTNFSSQLKELSRSAKELGSYDGAKKLQSQVENLKTSLSSLDKSDVNFDKKFSSAQKEANKLATTINKLGASFSSFDAQTESNKMLSWAKNNTAAGKETIATIKKLAIEMQNVNTVGEKNNILAQYKQLTTSAQAAGKTGLSGWDNFKRGAAQIGQFVGVYGMFQQGVQVARQMASAVIDVDSAMTNLYKVTDETASVYSKFQSESGNTAKSLGRNVSSYIEQTATWSKLGYDLNQSKELAKVSSVYANVGEVDDQTAVSDLVTTLKAFNIDTTGAEGVVDKLNKLGNEFATSSKDLGEGLSNSASALSLGGMDINKSLALLTGGAEITQSAGELGNALKIGQMRVMGMKGDLEALGEESEGIESVSKTQTHILNLTKGQVNIMNDVDSTKFKDYYDILQDVSEVYDQMEQTDRADLLETLFGKQRGNQGAAVIQAFQSGQIQKAYEATLNAEGSAQTEQDRWMQSAEADFCLVA